MRQLVLSSNNASKTYIDIVRCALFFVSTKLRLGFRALSRDKPGSSSALGARTCIAGGVVMLKKKNLDQFLRSTYRKKKLRLKKENHLFQGRIERQPNISRDKRWALSRENESSRVVLVNCLEGTFF